MIAFKFGPLKYILKLETSVAIVLPSSTLFLPVYLDGPAIESPVIARLSPFWT